MNILLISDDIEFAKSVQSKLIFLRKDDSLVISNYCDAESKLKLSLSDVVLVHENEYEEDSLDLIKDLRINENISIIFIANSNNKEMILSAYEAGADDFILASAEDYELVVRTVNNIKHNSIKNSALRNNKILEQLGVIDEVTGVYNYKYAKQVIENYIDDNLLDNGCFAVFASSEATIENFSVAQISTAILNSVRVNDVVTFGRGTKFYVLFPNTNINGVIVVLNKINEILQSSIKLCAGIVEIAHKDFSQMEEMALSAFSDAYATDTQFVVAEEKSETLDEWLILDEVDSKNYKIFRNVFNKKLEKIIIPVFYRLQKAWEEKLFNTKIEQFIDEEKCVFHLENKNQNSYLRIIYPGFAKILISTTHEGLDSPENSEIQLPLAKISQKELVSIVENFIKEFKQTSGREK